MGYNSEEEKKLAESMAEKNRQFSELFKDGKQIEKWTDAIDKLVPLVNELHEKSKHGPLSEEELKMLDQLQPALEKMMQTVSDAKLVIGNDIFAQATTYFFHVKKLAEEGNEDARKVYEKMLPNFKKAMEPGLDGRVGLN